jgi:SPP1 gp7 family putative phage head morphogenesis protein
MTLAAHVRYQALVAQHLGTGRKPAVRKVPLERARLIRFPAAAHVAYLQGLREIVAVLERAIAAEVLPELAALVLAHAHTDHADSADHPPRARRLAILGAPRAGKTTTALELGRRLGLPVHHADDLIALGWSEASDTLARSIAAAGSDGPGSDGIWEGVAVVRALRKLLAQSPDKPVEQVLVLRAPHVPLSPGQQRMAAACETVLREIEPELRARGVEFVDDAGLMTPVAELDMHQMHHDTAGDSVPVLFERVRQTVTSEVPTARIALLAQQNALRVSELNKSEVSAQINQVVKIDLFHPETGVPEHIHAFVAQQVALVRGLTESTMLGTQATVLEGIRQGLRHEEIAKKLVTEVGLSKTRAGIIAGDQVAKLNSELTRKRQTNLGLKRYRWATSGDVHVRPGHRALNGTVQLWSQPPVVNAQSGKRAHPGEDTNFYPCRCSAIAIVADLLEDTAPEPADEPVAPVAVPAKAPANDPGQVRVPRAPVAPAVPPALPAVPPALPQPPPANIPRPPPAAPSTPSKRVGATAEKVFGRKLTDAELDGLAGMNAKLPASMAVKYELQEFKDYALPVGDELAITDVVSLVGTIHDDEVKIAVFRRQFHRHRGQLTAFQELLELAEDRQGAGIGRELFNAQMDAYEAAGVERVHLNAAWVGKYVWSKARFAADDPAQLASLRKRLAARLTKKLGAQASAEIMARTATVSDIAGVVVDGEKVGKDFLIGLEEGIPMSASPKDIQRL